MPLTRNEALLQKADLQHQALTTDGGALVPGQAKNFIKLVVKEGVLTKLGTIKTLKQDTYKMPKARFGSRVLHAAHVATALSQAERSAPDLSQVELNTKLFKAEVRLAYEILEDSIERGKFAETVLELLADAISRDVDEIALMSNLASSDPDLAQFDGIRAQIQSHEVNAGGDSLKKEVFRDMVKQMPSEYFRRKANMLFLTSVDAEVDYRDSLMDRSTDMSDTVFGALAQAPSTIRFSGMPIVPLHMMPEDLGTGANETEVLLLEPKQICFGIQRSITLEMERDITASQHIMVLTTRWDVKMLHEQACVKATNVTVS